MRMRLLAVALAMAAALVAVASPGLAAADDSIEVTVKAPTTFIAGQPAKVTILAKNNEFSSVYWIDYALNFRVNGQTYLLDTTFPVKNNVASDIARGWSDDGTWRWSSVIRPLANKQYTFTINHPSGGTKICISVTSTAMANTKKSGSSVAPANVCMSERK